MQTPEEIEVKIEHSTSTKKEKKKSERTVQKTHHLILLIGFCWKVYCLFLHACQFQ
jgi:hypothetical protein